MMRFNFPQFKHVEWIMNEKAPKLDLAWSDLRPDWSGVVEDMVDISKFSASAPEGSQELIDHLSGCYGVDPSRVLLTNGCSEANWLGFLSMIEPGSKVLVEKPIYTPLLEIPRALGADVSMIKRRAPEFKFDLKELDKKLSEGVDLFVMQNLNNPTGRALFEDDLRELSSVLDDHGTYVLSDEVYRDFAITFDDGPGINAFPSMVEMYDRALITSSVTKVYGAGGLLGGWLIGPRRVINKARRVKSYSVPMVNMIANLQVLEILKNSYKVLPTYFNDIRTKERLVSQWAAGRNDVEWSSPDGCAVGFLMYDHDVPSVEMCRRLYTEKDVRVIPGEFFHHENGFRLSLAVDYDILKEALGRIDDMLDSL